MSSNTIASAAEFVRMTKEEKLRFCQDLIRQAANLKKSSRTSGSVRSKSAHAKSRTKSKPTGRSHSRLRRGASRVRSASKHKRSTKSVTEKKVGKILKQRNQYLSLQRRTSTVRLSSKPAGYSSKHAGKTRSTATRGHIRSKSKHANTQRKTHTEICAVQFVPKFDPSSSKNHVPIYHLIRHAFGNMVREAICQLDKDKTGVSSQQILDHILKHYSFPNNISKSAIRNRTLFTINAGLRAGTLLSAGSNKNIRIGRMRRVYPHKLR
ncbi:unnamed protein product [Adineta ricciae]|uniref:Uncharacterized protein n=1 Tax=Adineta ricciae TaxID=249248 RepID=A0A813PD64_ADIRI|nr:unnamed protein product [Adineta ricciae]